MSHQIDPLILQTLEAFSRRRRNLIILRGVCAAVAMLLATMLIIALIDWIFILPDWARWTLSGVAYAAVLLVEWRSSLRLLVHAPGPRRLARLVEHAEPKLREDLLSAVELGDPQSNAAFDSEEFRALVQSDVAHRMEGMEVERLLPVNLVRRYLGVAGAIVLALIVGFALTGTQLGTLLVRALLPGANLARVSKFQIHIVSPDQPETIVPHGETVPLVVEITGGRTNKAVLETFSPAGGREVVSMTPLAADKFSATIQVARENVKYRVRAGDAITRKYQLAAVARPHVVAFHKTYTFPKYARLNPRQMSEENGDLAALEGSEVEVQMEMNQAIKSGELRVEQGRKQYTVPLTAQPGNKLSGRLPLDASGTYRVFLVGAQTGFENKFSPEYELRAEPDLVPQVELEVPKQDLILPANEVLDLHGTASDDLAVAKVAQLVRVNGGPWKEFVLAQDAGAKANVERRWDLFEQGVKAGDLLATKLLAVDLKGSRAESRTIQITITASGFETKRITSLDTQRALLAALGELRAAAEVFEKGTGEARDLFERAGPADAERRQAIVSGTSAFEGFERKLAEVSGTLTATLRTAEPGHQSHDLVLLGRLLARLDALTVQTGRDSLQFAASGPAAPTAPEFMRQFSDSAARAHQQARQMQEAYRVFLAAEEVDVLAENMHVVMKEQERLNALAQNSGDDARKWSQLADRLRAVAGTTRGLEGQMTLAAAAHSQIGDRLKPFRKEIEKVRATLDQQPAGKDLRKPLEQLARLTADASRTLLDLKRDLAQKPVESVKMLLQEIEPTWVNFEKLRQEVQAASTNDKLPADARPRAAERRWELRGAVFKAHADLEETRPNSDSYFVADVRATTLAMQGFQGASAQSGWEKKLGELDLAFRVLESGHNLAETLDGLNHLAVNERWEIYTPRARTTNPRDWNWLEERLRKLPDELGKTQPPEQTRRSFEAAQKILGDSQKLPAWKLLGEEMRERFKPERMPMGLPQDVERVAALVKQALELLRQPMEEARQALAQLAPKVSELAEQLAKETEQLKKETEEHGAKTAEKQPDELVADAQQKIAQQQKLNEKVDALKDLIRAEANRQNVLEKEGREIARDADDALAMLKEPPPKAEQAFKDAAQVGQADLHEQAIREAAAEQQKLADSLNQIAQHFENVEQGKADETRLAMRATEEANGIKEQMDAQFAKAEQLAQMAQQSPEELLQQLEQALPQNPEMRKELSQIAQDTLTAAQQKLAQAAQAEQQIAKALEQLAAQPPPPAGIPPTAAASAKEAAKQAAAAAEAAREAANEAVQAAKKANNPAAADQARQARAKAQEGAQAAQQATQSAEQMAQPPKAAQAAQDAAQKAGEAAQKAQEAAAAAQQSMATADQAAGQQSGEPQAKNQQTSKEAGEAVQAAQAAARAAQMAQAAAQQAVEMAKNPQMAAQHAAAQPPNPQLAQSAQQQTPIAQKAQQAGENVARAGRHEERLTNVQTGAQLQQLGEEIQQTAAQPIPAAQQALAQAQTAKQAQAPVNAAQQELARELGQLQAALGSQPAAASQQSAPAQNEAAPVNPAPSAAASPADAASPASPPPFPGQATPPPGTPGGPPASPAEQMWMARTLDMLDTALNAPASAPSNQSGQTVQNSQPQPNQPGQNQPPQPSQPGLPANAAAQAQAAMAAAAQAATNAMKSARSEAASQPPSATESKSDLMDRSESGALAQAPGKAYQSPAEARGSKIGDWGKLPKQVAAELSQGQREAVAGEYRSQVETYYRVIAERAKKP